MSTSPVKIPCRAMAVFVEELPATMPGVSFGTRVVNGALHDGSPDGNHEAQRLSLEDSCSCKNRCFPRTGSIMQNARVHAGMVKPAHVKNTAYSALAVSPKD